MNTIRYKIASMYLMQSVVIPENYKSIRPLKIGNSFTFTSGGDKTDLICTHILVLKNKDDDMEFGRFILQTTFQMTEESVGGILKGNQLTVPQTFLVQCGSISYGTLRGIVLQNTLKAGLENIILPPLYVDTIIKDSLVIKL